jgi:predicted nucleic acid-binding protein
LRTIVFDTQALLVLYLGEAGSGMVEDYLEAVSEREVRGYLNVVNLAELYYILARRIDKTVADEKERNLRTFGVGIVPVRDGSSLWKEAAIIKARTALSLADAFAASTALQYGGTLLTGSDIEFERVENLKVERVSG